MLCQKIGEIFYHSDVANICPDKKKVNVDWNGNKSQVQICYQMESLKILFQKFQAES